MSVEVFIGVGIFVLVVLWLTGLLAKIINYVKGVSVTVDKNTPSAGIPLGTTSSGTAPAGVPLVTTPSGASTGTAVNTTTGAVIPTIPPAIGNVPILVKFNNESGTIRDKVTVNDKVSGSSITIPADGVLQQFSFSVGRLNDTYALNIQPVYLIREGVRTDLFSEVWIAAPRFTNLDTYKEQVITLDMINSIRTEEGKTAWNGIVKKGDIISADVGTLEAWRQMYAKLNGNNTLTMNAELMH